MFRPIRGATVRKRTAHGEPGRPMPTAEQMAWWGAGGGFALNRVSGPSLRAVTPGQWPAFA
jgi:hypothetical protein